MDRIVALVTETIGVLGLEMTAYSYAKEEWPERPVSLEREKDVDWDSDLVEHYSSPRQPHPVKLLIG